ncbi:hypothetical protein ES703_70731 [subsurface metagenome]
MTRFPGSNHHSSHSQNRRSKSRKPAGKHPRIREKVKARIPVRTMSKMKVKLREARKKRTPKGIMSLVLVVLAKAMAKKRPKLKRLAVLMMARLKRIHIIM